MGGRQVLQAFTAMGHCSMEKPACSLTFGSFLNGAVPTVERYGWETHRVGGGALGAWGHLPAPKHAVS